MTQSPNNSLEERIKGSFSFLNTQEKNGRPLYCVHDELNNCYDSIEEIQEAVARIVNQELSKQREDIIEKLEGMKFMDDGEKTANAYIEVDAHDDALNEAIQVIKEME